MRIAKALVAALFIQTLIGLSPANAVPTPPKITNVSVEGDLVTLNWTSSKLGSKEFYEVEFTNTVTGKKSKLIRTKSKGIGAVLEPFTKYSFRMRKSLASKVWTKPQTFITTSKPIEEFAALKVTYTSVELSWAAVPGATSYELYVDKKLTDTTSATNYLVKNLRPGSSSIYFIRAKKGDYFGETSPVVQATTLNQAPAKLTASGTTNTGTVLVWSPIEGASGYNVYSNKTLLANTTVPTYAVSGLLPGTSATYSVSALFGSFESSLSEAIEVNTLIDTPLVPTLSAITSSSVTASWTVDKNATSYEVVVYDATGTNAILTNTVNGSLGSTVFAGLNSLTSYTVGIKNVYGKTTSKSSSLATFTTLKPSITNVVVNNVTTTSATLNWYPFSGVINYEVYRDGILIPQATSQMTSASVAYAFTGLSPGNTHRFAVRASYLDGNKTVAFTDLVEVTQNLLTDPSFAPAISSTVPTITLPYATVPIVGATLSASTGIWTSITTISGYAYQWQRSLDGGSTWANLLGETRSTYKVTANDYGFRLRVRVSATNPNGTGFANSAQTSLVAETYNVQIPVIRGTLVSGQLLEATDGSWSSDYPLTFRYQWNRNGNAISGQISPSYTLTDSDINTTISVSVIASSSLGSVSSESTIRSAVAAAGNTVAPVISGTVRAYNTLTTTDGTWLKSPTITYQWQRSTDLTLWNNIAGATSSSYSVAVGDVGYYIRVQVFGSRTVSGVEYRYTSPSQPTVIVPALTAISTTAPVVSGSWTEGSTLTTTNGTWNSSGTFTYQWQRSANNSTWENISGATASSYVLTSSEASKYVRVQVLLSGTSGTDGVAYSVSTAKVGAPYNTAAPAISGTVRVGVAQSVSTGTWSGSPTYTYQWQTSSDGIVWTNLNGATNSSYTPTFAVANLRLRAVVSAANAVDTATATSQVVQGFLAPIATDIPAISGTVSGTNTLTTSDGTWPGSPNTFTYAWHRSSDGGVTWTNIAGATASTYTLTAGDAGYRIRSQVTVTTNASSSTAYSLPTAAVAP